MRINEFDASGEWVSEWDDYYQDYVSWWYRMNKPMNLSARIKPQISSKLVRQSKLEMSNPTVEAA